MSGEENGSQRWTAAYGSSTCLSYIRAAATWLSELISEGRITALIKLHCVFCMYLEGFVCPAR